MKYEFLNNLSGATVLIVVTLVSTMIFEVRYTKKQYMLSLIPFLTILVSTNLAVIFGKSFPIYAKYTLILATLPSLIYFYIVSKHRDGRFFFTFCLVDTSSIWFAIFTGVIDYFAQSEGIINFILRVSLAPIVLYLVKRYFRNFFLNLLNTVEKGWWLFTALTSVVYIMLIVVSTYPVSIRERPDDIPLMCIILVFLPLIYTTIFYVLNYQKKLHNMHSLQNTFKIQSDMIENRAKELKASEERMEDEKLEISKKIKEIREFTQNGEDNKVLSHINEMEKKLDDTKLTHYCSNPILDAILVSYFKQAKENNIKLKVRLNIADEIPVNVSELSIVFANALENAINACKKIPIEQRQIIFTCIHKPTLMFEIQNPYVGTIHFSKDGIPISDEYGHGFGSKSIVTFCKKYNAIFIYKAENNWFSLKVGL